MRNFLDGGRWTLIDEFIEIESGKRADRPTLAEAMRAAKRHKATKKRQPPVPIPTRLLAHLRHPDHLRDAANAIGSRKPVSLVISLVNVTLNPVEFGLINHLSAKLASS